MIGNLPLSGLWQSFKDRGQHDPATVCLHTYFSILLQFLKNGAARNGTEQYRHSRAIPNFAVVLSSSEYSDT